ncbi:MAG: ribonuclease III [Gammaproteobacteria bacterium]|nr:ribonuclease III [Gammaproteobacteria bacterium]
MVLDNDAALSSLESQLGYQFQNREILKLALTHRSAGYPNNERLEYLGDAVLGYVIAEYLFKQGYSEDQMSLMRANFVKRDTLADIARGMNLGRSIVLGAGARKDGGHDRNSILADTLEAIIGAVHVDGGMDSGILVINNLFIRGNSDRFLNVDKDSKTTLQELLQGMGFSLPRYIVIDESGPAHKRRFKVRCDITELNLSFESLGGSRKEAEQRAAGNLIDMVKERG